MKHSKEILGVFCFDMKNALFTNFTSKECIDHSAEPIRILLPIFKVLPVD